MYGVELTIMIVATLSLSLSSDGDSLSVVGVIIFWRVILGIGIGGDYPSSAVITSELANIRHRGGMMAAVFANQGWGQFAAALVSFLCAVWFRNSLQDSSSGCDGECQAALDKAWRLLYGLGIIPAVLGLGLRLTIPETIRYTLEVSPNNTHEARVTAIRYVSGEDELDEERDGLEFVDLHTLRNARVQQPEEASISNFIHHFSLWKNGKVLLGTALCWFFVDITFVRLALRQLLTD